MSSYTLTLMLNIIDNVNVVINASMYNPFNHRRITDYRVVYNL
jgi:hypothetical protein